MDNQLSFMVYQVWVFSSSSSSSPPRGCFGLFTLCDGLAIFDRFLCSWHGCFGFLHVSFVRYHLCASQYLILGMRNVLSVSARDLYTMRHYGIRIHPRCRRSSVEAKRLDSLLRSVLYASYSGAFREIGRVIVMLTPLPNSIRCFFQKLSLG